MKDTFIAHDDAGYASASLLHGPSSASLSPPAFIAAAPLQ